MIESRSNPKIKLARSLRTRKARKSTGLFLAEGLAVISAALRASAPIDMLLVDRGRLQGQFSDQILGEAETKKIEIFEVSEAVFASLSERQGPQGIAAVIRQREVPLPEAALHGVGLALVSPQDPGNLGTVLRTLDALGGGTLLLLDGGVDPWHPTAVKASMGALFGNPLVRTDFATFQEWCQARSIHLYGSSAGGSQAYSDFKPKTPWVLLLGSEQKGLSDEQLTACDQVLAIPMRGAVSSLNLSVAAGLLLNALAA